MPLLARYRRSSMKGGEGAIKETNESVGRESREKVYQNSDVPTTMEERPLSKEAAAGKSSCRLGISPKMSFLDDVPAMPFPSNSIETSPQQLFSLKLPIVGSLFPLICNHLFSLLKWKSICPRPTSHVTAHLEYLFGALGSGDTLANSKHNCCSSPCLTVNYLYPMCCLHEHSDISQVSETHHAPCSLLMRENWQRQPGTLLLPA